MDRLAARRLLIVSAEIGVIGAVALWAAAPGINWLIVVGSIMLSALVVRPARTPFDPMDSWMPAAALALAAFVAVRSDPFLVLVNVVLALGLVLGTVVALAGIPLTRSSAGRIVDALGLAMLMTAIGGGLVVGDARPSLRPGRHAGAEAVGRGLLVSVPLVFVFAVLFASADAVFARGIREIIGFRIGLGDVPGQTLFAISIGWLAVGLLALVHTGLWEPAVRTADRAQGSEPPAVERAGPEPGQPSIAARSFVGPIEATVALIVVDILFATFVGLQAGYLFGGLNTLEAVGLTYSDYARRGFFELVMVAGLVVLVVVTIDGVVRPRTRWLRIAGWVLLGLTLAVLASSALRLKLYQDAYGWTELRFYVYASIGWLGVGIVAAAWLLGLGRLSRLPHVMAVATAVFILGINVIGPQALVAARNIERAINPSLVPADGRAGLGAAYVASLGDDAVPVLVSALPQLAEPDRSRVLAHLRGRASVLGNEPSVRAWGAWNLARERARSALAQLR